MESGATVQVTDGRTIRNAVDLCLEDKAQQSLSPNWERKVGRELNEFLAWCDRKTVILLREVTLERLEAYRKEWSGAAISRRKRQERLRQFFRYCQRLKWIEDNPAALLPPL